MVMNIRALQWPATEGLTTKNAAILSCKDVIHKETCKCHKLERLYQNAIYHSNLFWCMLLNLVVFYGDTAITCVVYTVTYASYSS